MQCNIFSKLCWSSTCSFSWNQVLLRHDVIYSRHTLIHKLFFYQQQDTNSLPPLTTYISSKNLSISTTDCGRFVFWWYQDLARFWSIRLRKVLQLKTQFVASTATWGCHCLWKCIHPSPPWFTSDIHHLHRIHTQRRLTKRLNSNTKRQKLCVMESIREQIT